MGDVIRGKAVNYINFVIHSYKEYQKTDKKQRYEKALRKLKKFLQQYPEMKELVQEKLREEGIAYGEKND